VRERSDQEERDRDRAVDGDPDPPDGTEHSSQGMRTRGEARHPSEVNAMPATLRQRAHPRAPMTTTPRGVVPGAVHRKAKEEGAPPCADDDNAARRGTGGSVVSANSSPTALAAAHRTASFSSVNDAKHRLPPRPS